MTKNIGLKFGIDKCGAFAMKRRKGVGQGVSTLVFWRNTIYVRRGKKTLGKNTLRG